jgi:hypothetical protein
MMHVGRIYGGQNVHVKEPGTSDEITAVILLCKFGGPREKPVDIEKKIR